MLKCIRADGTTTWQKQSERHAAFFSLHDLTHFAVETTLGLKRAFFGLIAEGWDIEDTTGKGARGPLPAEAIEVERVAWPPPQRPKKQPLLTGRDGLLLLVGAGCMLVAQLVVWVIVRVLVALLRPASPGDSD